MVGSQQLATVTVSDSKKCRRSDSSGTTDSSVAGSGRSSKRTKHLEDIPTRTAGTTTSSSSSSLSHNYTRNRCYPPIGMVWSQNSCAYDSIFTILFNIWCHNPDGWGTIFTQLGNEFCILLVHQFTRYKQNEISLEAARDTVQKELDKTSQYMRFGSYTSIEVICEAIFTTCEAIYHTYYRCPDNHRQFYSQSHSIYMTKGRSPFKSTTK